MESAVIIIGECAPGVSPNDVLIIISFSKAISSFQILLAFAFKLLPYRVLRTVFIKETFDITVERVHFVDSVHGVIGSAYPILSTL